MYCTVDEHRYMRLRKYLLRGCTKSVANNEAYGYEIQSYFKIIPVDFKIYVYQTSGRLFFQIGKLCARVDFSRLLRKMLRNVLKDCNIFLVSSTSSLQ